MSLNSIIKEGYVCTSPNNIIDFVNKTNQQILFYLICINHNK